jgi:hypothetical protein
MSPDEVHAVAVRSQDGPDRWQRVDRKDPFYEYVVQSYFRTYFPPVPPPLPGQPPAKRWLAKDCDYMERTSDGLYTIAIGYLDGKWGVLMCECEVSWEAPLLRSLANRFRQKP